MAYANYASITIDNTQVSGSANLTNFPVLVSGTYDGTGGEPDLRTAANGGNIQNTASGGSSGSYTVPADLVFSPNTDGSSPYDFEIEYYDATTGEIVAWVEVSTVTYDSDTVFYVVYGDASVNTSQENVNGTWEINYKAVYHLNGTLDSTSNANTLTDATTADAAGRMGRARDFTASESDTMYRDNDSDFEASGTTAWEMSVWFRFETFSSSANYEPIGTFPDHTTAGVYKTIIYHGAVNQKIRLYDYVNPTGVFAEGPGSIAADTWYHAVGKSDGSNIWLVVNGTAYTPVAHGSQYAGGDSLVLSRGVGVSYTDGLIDESRWYSGGYHTDDWTITEYNNQKEGSTFYTMGSETAAGGGSGGVITPFFLKTLT